MFKDYISVPDVRTFLFVNFLSKIQLFEYNSSGRNVVVLKCYVEVDILKIDMPVLLHLNLFR